MRLPAATEGHLETISVSVRPVVKSVDFLIQVAKEVEGLN